MRKQNYRKKVSRRPSGKKAIIRKALSTNWKKSVSRVVKNVLKRSAERKEVGNAYASNLYTTHGSYYQSAQFKQNNIVCFTPIAASSPNALITISQGTHEGARIGNEVNPKSLVYKGIIVPSATTAAGGTNPSPFQPVELKFVVFSFKRQFAETVDQVYTTATTNMFDAGAFFSGLTYLSGVPNILDMVKDFNNDVITVHKVRTFKLGGQYSQTGAPGGGASNPQLADFKFNCKFKMNLTKYLPKRITFNDSDDNSTSKQLYGLWIATDAGGQSPDTWNPQGVWYRIPCKVFGDVKMTYTDM